MKKKIEDISYLRLMFCYLMVCLIILALAIRGFNTLSVSNNVSQMERMAGLLAEKVNGSISYMVAQAQNTAKLLYMSENISEKEVYEKLRESIQDTSYISAGIFTEDGSYYGLEAEKDDLEKHGFAEIARKRKDSYITEAYRSSLTGRSVITIFEPVSQNGVEKGEIFLTFSIKMLQEVASTEVLKDESETFLMNAYSGNYIYCNDGPGYKAGNWNNLKLARSEMKFEKGYSYEKFVKDMRSGVDKGVVCYWIDNKKYTQAYINIHEMDGWYAVVRIENDKLSDFFKEYAVKIIIYFVILAVVTALLVILLFRKEAARKKDLEKLSVIDPLTGIMNRRAFETCVRDYMREEENGKGILIFVDIDNFKGINDKFGHGVGDTVLKVCAEAFRKCFRRTDIVGRFGGDEFIIFVKGEVPSRRIEDIFSCIASETRDVQVSDTRRISVHYSAGLARYPKDAGDYEKLCECADQALYAVKAAGKASFRWYQK